MGIAAVLIAVLLIGVVCSTTETRAAGAAMVRPYGRVLVVLTLLFWAAVFWFH